MTTVVELIKERFSELTEIQKLAIPKILAGENTLILAPTGSGKCVSGDTLIFTDKGPVKIEDFYHKAVSVNSLNQKLRTEFSKGLVIRKRKSELFRVITESGREVKVTDDHKFLTLKGGVLRWFMLKELTNGDFIGCARKMLIGKNTEPKFTLNLLEKCEDHICVKTNPTISKLIGIIKKKKNGMGLRRIAPLVGVHRATLMHAMKNHNMQVCTYLKLVELAEYDSSGIEVTEIGGPASKTIKVPKINEDLAYFAGLFAGDGNFNQGNTIRFSTASPALLYSFKKFCNDLGLCVGKDKSKKYDYYVCNKPLYVILTSLGLEDKNKSARICIPSLFFSKLPLIAAFLRGLFDTDGSVTKEIEYCTKSKQMAKEVQLALLYFGILSRLRIKTHNKYGIYYRIFVSDSENICRFVSSIGFGHPEKLLKTKKFFSMTHNPNKDIIPGIAARIKSYKEKLGVPYKLLRANRSVEAYMYGYRNPSRYGLKRMLRFFSRFGETNESSFLRALSTSDIFWDKIIEISRAGENYVYDATVPGNSNFIGNGIILHNTEACLLPVLEKIKDKKDGIRALYITPLRSLNRDLLGRFNWWCDRLEVTHDVRHGDTTQAEREKHRRNPPQILIVTCETLQALLLGPIMRKHLAKVEFIIVDEVHDILDNKRGVQLSLGLERLAEIANFQRIAISATVSNEFEAAKLIFGSSSYAIAEVGKGRKFELSVEHIPKHEDRIKRLKELSETHRCLIFVNTRSTAEELGASLKKLEAPVELHHGSLSKDVRIAAEEKFKKGEIKSLIATSSLELGIDIGDVDLVVQFGSPHQAFRLIQRIGRSGHSLEKTPKGIIIATDFDDKLEAEAIKIRAENRWLEDKRIERGALDVIAHQFIGVCMDKGRTDLKSIHAILSRSSAYAITLAKLNKVALQLYSEGIIFYDQIELDGENANIALKTRARQYYYSNLSTIPREKRYLLRDMAGNKIISSLDEKFVANLENGASFLSKGMPWQVVDITEREVIAVPSSALDIAIPEWAGEDIPISFEVAQDVGVLRKVHRRDGSPIIPDDKTVIIEIVEDLVVIHACFGSKVNEAIARMLSVRISELIGETVRAVADPYRIVVKLPFPLDEKNIKTCVDGLRNANQKLLESLENSFLLKLKFLHIGRLFGLLDDDATVTGKFISAMRNSVVYEETIRSIFFRYFDVEKTEEVLQAIKSGKIKLIYDKRKELSYFGKLGIDRLSAKEALGGFEPRQAMITSLKERTLAKTLELKCLSCAATRFLHLAGAPEEIKCHKCNEKSLTVLEKKAENKEEMQYKAALIRNYGKKALVALSVYGIGARTAERVLSRLQKDEDSFYWDMLEAQKNFIKNRKYWSL
ncbi:MAG: DEAD/DEAH box helicase [Candidatus Micrarchaeota archaeon]|nr:DEAD/DEAH box helicase [Candidatus Micrarchaeota archaeon]